MAKVIYTIPVTSFIGSIGGTTYQSNKSGYIARNKPFNSKARNRMQNLAISRQSYLSQVYKNLTGTQKASWSSQGATYPHVDFYNRIKTIDGLRWFIIINSFPKQPIGAEIVFVPSLILATPLPAMTATIAAASLTLNAAIPFGLPTESLFIYASSPLSTSTGTPRKSFRYLTTVAANIAQPLNLTAVWQSVFGLSVNDSLFVPRNQVVIAVTKFVNLSHVPTPFTFARS